MQWFGSFRSVPVYSETLMSLIQSYRCRNIKAILGPAWAVLGTACSQVR